MEKEILLEIHLNNLKIIMTKLIGGKSDAY